MEHHVALALIAVLDIMVLEIILALVAQLLVIIIKLVMDRVLAIPI